MAMGGDEGALMAMGGGRGAVMAMSGGLGGCYSNGRRCRELLWQWVTEEGAVMAMAGDGGGYYTNGWRLRALLWDLYENERDNRDIMKETFLSSPPYGNGYMVETHLINALMYENSK